MTKQSKQRSISLPVSAEEQIKELQKELGIMSKSAIVQMAISVLYQRMLVEKRRNEIEIE